MLRAFGEKLHTQVLYFSSRRKLERGIYLEDGKIIYADGKPEVLCKVEELKLLGTHNYENVMAASAMAAAYGVPLSSIRETIRNFGGVATGSNLWRRKKELHTTMTPREQIRMLPSRQWRR